jgi:hypothetical protein
LAKSGSPPKQLQIFANDLDPKTTLQHYAKISSHDLEVAVKCLPDLAPKCFVTGIVNSMGANFVVPSVVPLLCQNDDIQKTQLVAIESSNEV